MRLLATIEGKEKAEALAAYLFVQSISTHVEEGTTNHFFDVWIRDEDRLSEARDELTRFLENPTANKYGDAISEAQKLLRDQQIKRDAASKNIKSGKSVFRNIPGTDIVSGAIPPITMTLIVLSVIVSFTTEFMQPKARNTIGTICYDQLTFVSKKDFQLSKDPSASLKHGELWRAITPIFLHAWPPNFPLPIHLLFNVLAIAQLGRIVEKIEGTIRFTVLVLFTAVLSNLLQGLMPPSLLGNHLFGGLSGVVYGVFAYLWITTLLRPNMGFLISNTSVAIMLGWLALGFTNTVGPIANLAHLGGLITGGIIAVLVVTNEGLRRPR